MKIDTQIQSQYKIQNKLKEHIKDRINERMDKLCYINFGKVPKIYVTKYDDWCNLLVFFVCFRP